MLACCNASSTEVEVGVETVWVILAYDRVKVSLHAMRPRLEVGGMLRQDSVGRLSG